MDLQKLGVAMVRHLNEKYPWARLHDDAYQVVRAEGSLLLCRFYGDRWGVFQKCSEGFVSVKDCGRKNEAAAVSVFEQFAGRDEIPCRNIHVDATGVSALEGVLRDGRVYYQTGTGQTRSCAMTSDWTPFHRVLLTENKAGNSMKTSTETATTQFISDEAIDVLRNHLEIKGSRVKITKPLDTKLDPEVKEVLELLGGVWVRTAKAHIFPTDADVENLIEDTVASGEKPSRIVTPEALPSPEAEVRKVLRDGIEIEGRYLKITGQIERKLYVKVDEVLRWLGGEWKKGKKAHEFPEDANVEELITNYLASDASPVWNLNPLSYFPTPRPVIEKMIEWATESLDEFPLCRIGEPQAGEGHIADIVGRMASDLAYAAGILPAHELLLVELDPGRIKILEEKGYAVTAGDFLKVKVPRKPVDCILMNPPFAVEGKPLAYIDHIWRAYLWVRSGGIIISVVPGGFVENTDAKTEGLRSFIRENGKWEMLPEGSFSESGTEFGTALVLIRKP